MVLLLDGPRYGYDIKKDAGAILGGAALHNNLVYPLLARFRAHGWVRRKKRPGKRGQTRHFYTLTRAGKREVQRRLRAFSEKDAENDAAFRLRVGLFSALDRRTRRAMVAARERALRKRKARLQGIGKHFDVERFGRAAIRLRQRFVEVELNWLRGVRRLDRRRR